MYWLSVLKNMASALFRTNGRREPQGTVLPSSEGHSPDKVVLREESALTPHFSLFELTVTTKQSLQKQNRTLSDTQLMKLNTLAAFCERIRGVCGNSAVRIHSGYRSPSLNGATVGSSTTSQHPKCEAVDFDVAGQNVQETFNKILAAAKTGSIQFGQLILERAEREYGVVEWVHCSAVGSLDPKKVGQVMKMIAGRDGKPNYLLIDQIKYS